MSANAPWSVKGIDPQAREIAKDLARRSGQTLGEWINSMIIEGGKGEAPAGLRAEPDKRKPLPKMALGRGLAPRGCISRPKPRPDQAGTTGLYHIPMIRTHDLGLIRKDPHDSPVLLNGTWYNPSTPRREVQTGSSPAQEEGRDGQEPTPAGDGVKIARDSGDGKQSREVIGVEAAHWCCIPNMVA